MPLNPGGSTGPKLPQLNSVPLHMYTCRLQARRIRLEENKGARVPRVEPLTARVGEAWPASLVRTEVPPRTTHLFINQVGSQQVL